MSITNLGAFYEKKYFRDGRIVCIIYVVRFVLQRKTLVINGSSVGCIIAIAISSCTRLYLKF